MQNKQQKGAVTVFLVIILMACFMFGGFFIDSARILVAKRHVKNAVNSAARSTLSYYDESLAAEYGLFAVDGSSVNANFNKYLTNNLTKSKDDGMSMFKYKIGTATATAQRPLEGDELHRQIVEYEKYRGPVNITLGVIEKFKKIFDNTSVDTDKISNATDSISNFKDKFKDSGGVLATAKRSIKNTVKENLKTGIKKKLSSVTTEWVTNTLPADLKIQYDEAEKQIKNAEKTLENLKIERNKYVNAAKDVCDGSEQTNSSAQANEYINQDKTLQQQADEQIAQLEADIKKAREILADVKKDIEAVRNPLATVVSNWEKKKAELIPAEQSYNIAKGNRESAEKEKNAAQSTVNEYNKTIANANGTISWYKSEVDKLEKSNAEIATLLNEDGIDIHNDEEWKTYCRLVDKSNRTKEESEWMEDIEELYNDVFNSTFLRKYTMMKNYKEISSYNSKIVAKQNELLKAQSSLVSANNKLSSATSTYNNAVAEENKWKEKVDAIKAEIKRLEDDIVNKQDTMAKAADKLNNIPDFDIEGVTVPELKTKVSGLADTVAQYSNLFNLIKSAGETLTKSMAAVTTGNGEQVVNTEEKNIITLMNSIKSNLQAIAKICTNPESLRDEMYYIDYVMDKNTYLTSQTSRSHYFNKAEVEYIIYGFDSQGANIIAAVGSIYGIRFIIDSVNYFFVDNPCYELISRIGWAIGKGAVQAALDMVDMLVDFDGEGAKGCAICPSLDDLNLRLSYSDHLRLFLLMNSGTSKDALKNTISTTLVKEKNTKDLNQMYTQIKADVEVEVNLIILPMLGSDLLPNNHFRNGSYVIHESIVEGYE